MADPLTPPKKPRRIAWAICVLIPVVVAILAGIFSDAPRATAPDTSATLHHAAQEMALDGFQFDKKDRGWPHDAGIRTREEFLACLVRNGYLSSGDAGVFFGIRISNLSDSDPGETAFLRSPPDVRPIRVVRKDGVSEIFSGEAEALSFAPPPPRDPEWLP